MCYLVDEVFHRAMTDDFKELVNSLFEDVVESQHRKLALEQFG